MKSPLNTNPRVLLSRGGVVVDILRSGTDAWNEWIGRSGSTAESGDGGDETQQIAMLTDELDSSLFKLKRKQFSNAICNFFRKFLHNSF